MTGPDGDRARITLVFILFVTVALVLLAALYPVYADLLNQNASELTPGQALLFQLVLPALVLVMMSITWRKAVGGA